MAPMVPAQVLGLCSQVHVGAPASPAREGCAVKTELWGNLGLCFKVRFVIKNGHSYLEFLRNGWNLEESRASVDAQGVSQLFKGKDPEGFKPTQWVARCLP